MKSFFDAEGRSSRTGFLLPDEMFELPFGKKNR